MEGIYLLQPPPAEQKEIQHARDFIDKILKILESLKLEEMIKTIDQDILGAYFYNIPEIQIYWMVIGLMAVILSVSVESLTIVKEGDLLVFEWGFLIDP